MMTSLVRRSQLPQILLRERLLGRVGEKLFAEGGAGRLTIEIRRETG
jgi:hypothetical protein